MKNLDCPKLIAALAESNLISNIIIANCLEVLVYTKTNDDSSLPRR